MIAAYIPNKKWDVSFTVNGFLAGLVAITCPCYWVSPTGAILLGGVAGVLVVMGVEVLEWMRIDDPIGAVPVHGLAAIVTRTVNVRSGCPDRLCKMALVASSEASRIRSSETGQSAATFARSARTCRAWSTVPR